MKLGKFEIEHLVERSFKLDGGQMFGVIPKSMWSRMLPPDDNNLIPMVTNLFLLKANGKNILFDAGLGDTLTEREMKVYGTDNSSGIHTGLNSLGLTETDIDIVILSHLHTDHAAGAVMFDDEGKFIPRFPNARHYVGKREWEDALNPNERTAAVYVPERYQTLLDKGLIEFIEFEEDNSSVEILPGITAVHTGGHTHGHFGIEIESDGENLFYYADILPDQYHLKVPFVPATDLLPLDTMKVKRSLLKRIVDKNVIVAFDHDTTVVLAKVISDGHKMKVLSMTEATT